MKTGSGPFGNTFGLVGAILVMAGGEHTIPAHAAEPAVIRL
jgi:hypothetical protein